MSGEVIMYRKIFIAVLVLGLLAGCEKNIPEVTEGVSETGITSADISESSMTESVSTTVTIVSTVVSEEAETTSASADTDTEMSERERAEFVKLAEENPAVKVDILTDEKGIYNSADMLVGHFYAEYPVISGADGEVCEKINGAVQAHIDGILKEQQDYMYDFGVLEDGRAADKLLWWNNDLERKEIRTIRCEINCNYGNLFSVYFNEYSYNMVLPEKHYVPYTMVFDLRTGEQVDFDEIISDRKSFDGVFEKAFADYGSYEKYESGSMYYPVYMGECDYMLFDYVTVKNDCLGMYLAKPTSRDSMPTEINEICVPISNVAPYLTEEGRKLFEGFASAKSEPVNIIEKNGEKYFDIRN